MNCPLRRIEIISEGTNELFRRHSPDRLEKSFNNHLLTSGGTLFLVIRHNSTLAVALSKSPNFRVLAMNCLLRRIEIISEDTKELFRRQKN